MRRASRGSWDCQVHVFGDPAKYPPKPVRSYEPPPSRSGDLDRMHASLGIERTVLVQPAVYGTDHRLLLDCLRAGSRYRGVAVINDSVSDEELQALHRAGVRGARFNFGGVAQGGYSRDEFDRSIGRIERLGWHAKIGGTADEIVRHEPWLRDLQIVAVLDHLAAVNPANGKDQPIFRMALELLRRENWWLLLSNGDRRSSQARGWDDVVPFVQAYVAAAPERTIWGTDWPHILYGKPAVPDVGDLLDFFYRCVADERARRRVLMENPSRLYASPE